MTDFEPREDRSESEIAADLYYELVVENPSIMAQTSLYRSLENLIAECRRFRSLREVRRLTLDEVARAVDLPAEEIAAIEAGKIKDMRVISLLVLADFYRKRFLSQVVDDRMGER